jgi:hypothetical protein
VPVKRLLGNHANTLDGSLAYGPYSSSRELISISLLIEARIFGLAYKVLVTSYEDVTLRHAMELLGFP